MSAGTLTATLQVMSTWPSADKVFTDSVFLLGQYAQGIAGAIWMGLDERLKDISAREVEVKGAADLAEKEGLMIFSYRLSYRSRI